jgi:hypothetical protein
MPGLLMRHAVVPQLSRTAAGFERIIFNDENRCNHQQRFLCDLASRKFNPDCSWDSSMGSSSAADFAVGRLSLIGSIDFPGEAEKFCTLA